MALLNVGLDKCIYNSLRKDLDLWLQHILKKQIRCGKTSIKRPIGLKTNQENDNEVDDSDGGVDSDGGFNEQLLALRKTSTSNDTSPETTLGDKHIRNFRFHLKLIKTNKYFVYEINRFK